jgi:phenylalanyl-tRNA synthetase beta chain
VPANRYDLLCVEGLARAFRIFLGLEEPPHFKIHNVSEPQQLTITSEVAPVRRFMVSGLLSYFLALAG